MINFPELDTDMFKFRTKNNPKRFAVSMNIEPEEKVTIIRQPNTLTYEIIHNDNRIAELPIANFDGLPKVNHPHGCGVSKEVFSHFLYAGIKALNFKMIEEAEKINE